MWAQLLGLDRSSRVAHIDHPKFFSQRDTLRQRAPLSMESIQRMSDSTCIGNATRGLVLEAVISTAIFT